MTALVDLRSLILGPWAARAACRRPGVDPRTFTTRDREGEAKAICERCPVMLDCRAYALAAGEEHDVWGGWSAADRRRGGRRVRKREHRARTLLYGSDERTALVQLLAIVHQVLTDVDVEQAAA